MSEGPNFEYQPEGQTLVVTVLRNVTSVADQDLKAELEAIKERMREERVRAVIFDFSQVSFFGSTMLEALLIMWKSAQAHNCQMSLCNVSRVGREVLHVSKFDTIWQIFPTRKAALQALAA